MAKTSPIKFPVGEPPPSAHQVESVTAAGELVDVWSRSGGRYRVRAILLLILNIVLFAAVGSFAYWLRSGEVFAPARDDYWDLLAQTFRGVGRAEVSLGSLLIEPISVQAVPIQIPIVGLLMAALISIPILVAILYRFWSSLPLIAVVGFLGVMPWLAVTLLGSCILASMRPFRTRFRFMSALIGLVPAIVYLTLAWSGTTEAVVGRIDPVDRVKFVAPWVLAIVASTLVFAIVLAIAKMVDYRPGAVTPLLAVMFGLPVALFEFHVGRDELYYRLLEKLDQAHFAEVDATDEWEKSALRAWEQHPLPRPAWEAVREIEEEKWLFELATDIGPRQSELTRHQAELSDRCDRFQRFFPDSPYTPNALFIKARAWDRRVDLPEFKATKWIRFYDDFPSSASREAWRIILENRPDTALGAVALLRLAQLEAREGDVERATAKLTTLVDRFDTTLLMAGAPKGVLARGTPDVSLEIRLERVILEAHRLRELLLANRDPIYGYDPLCGSHRGDDSPRWGLLDLDPRHERYVEHLKSIQAKYPKCQLEDNLELEIAKATPSLAIRIELLEALWGRFPHGDATPEAVLRLGMAYQAGEVAARSDDTFARLARDWPDSIWARQAAGFANGILSVTFEQGRIMTPPSEGKQIIVGVTGASGAIYARRLIECLCDAGVTIHLVITPNGRRLLSDELGLGDVSVDTLLGRNSDLVVTHPYRDVGSVIGSGSFRTDGMIVCPCSGNTLAAIAAGLGGNLLDRAAAVTLKEGRRLVLVPREMPMSRIELQNALRLSEAGAIICPASPGFYMLPTSIEDLVDFVAGKLLDLMDIGHQLNTRWSDRLESAAKPESDRPRS